MEKQSGRGRKWKGLVEMRLKCKAGFQASCGPHSLLQTVGSDGGLHAGDQTQHLNGESGLLNMADRRRKGGSQDPGLISQER